MNRHMTIREQHEAIIYTKYGLVAEHESLETIRSVLSDFEWSQYQRCLKYPRYGSRLVSEGSGVLS